MRGIVIGLLAGFFVAGAAIYLLIGSGDDSPETTAEAYERALLRHAERVLDEAEAPGELCAGQREARRAVDATYPGGLVAVSVDAVYHEVVRLCKERDLWGGE